MSKQLPRRVFRSKTDRMISGVSGGLAEYFDIDPVLVRLLWVLAAIFTGGMAIIAYVALWIIVPEEGYVGAARDTARRNVQEIRAEAERLARDVRQTVRGEPIAAEQSSHSAADEPAAPTQETGEQPYSAEPGVQSESAGAFATGPRFTAEADPQYRRRRANWAGIVLILVGALFLASNLGLFWWFNWRTAWPVVLIIIGALLLWSRARE